MAFWSGESLATRLRSEDIIPEAEFSSDRVDCAAYTLLVGAEVYVSPSVGETAPDKVTARRLDPGEMFPIPPGQFAFITTEERLKIPKNALGFISMKSSIKLRGLINVSGFHVDPGYSGKLVFAVFNAGPRPVHLARGEECFLIWLSSLDNDETKSFRKKPGFENLPSDLITKISGPMLSFEGLSAKISEVKTDYDKRIHELETSQATLKVYLYAIFGLLVAAIAQPLLKAGSDQISAHWPIASVSSSQTQIPTPSK